VFRTCPWPFYIYFKPCIKLEGKGEREWEDGERQGEELTPLTGAQNEILRAAQEDVIDDSV